MKVVTRVWSAVEIYVQAMSFLAAILCVFAFAAPQAQAATALTEVQIQAITNLLSSFGAEKATIDNVQLALHGASREDLIKATRPSSAGAAGMASTTAPQRPVPQLGTAACALFNRTLGRGSVGEDVSKLQEILRGTGDFTEVSTSTYFGAKTEAALHQWQVRMNIASSSSDAAVGAGQAGPRTRELLSRICGSTTSGEKPPMQGQNAGTSSSPVCILNADKVHVDAGQSVTLTWDSKNATYAGSASGERMAPKGSLVVNPTETTTYQKRVYGPNGEAECQATVQVGGSGPSTAAPVKKLVFGSGSYWSQLLSTMQVGAAVLADFFTAGTSKANAAAAALTQTQISAIANLLVSFGADQATINRVVADLGGSNTSTPPSCSITSDKASYKLGETAVLTWGSKNATYAAFVANTSTKDTLLVPGDKLPASGSQRIAITVLGNPVVTLAVYAGIGGISSTCKTTIVVPEQPPAPTAAIPTCSLKASVATIKKGGSVTLTWGSTNATSASTPAGSKDGKISGSTVVTPTEDTTYVKRVYGPGGEASCQVQIDVAEDKDGTAPSAKVVVSSVSSYFGQLLSTMQLGAVAVGEAYSGFLSSTR